MAFLLLIFSLPLMKLSIPVGGFAATATDALFLVAAACLAIAVARGEAKLRWNALYGVLLAYFAAMAASALAAADPAQAALKLATQAYLLAIPLLACSLIDSREDLRAAFRWWLAATAVTAGIGVFAVVLFAAGVGGSLVDYALHPFGTLPPGNYPRLESTFFFPALLCNYLTVSLLILLVARRLGWIGAVPFFLLLAALGVTALFTLTPALGGLIFALGLWLYAAQQNWGVRVGSLALGFAAASLSVLMAAVTPLIHPTAPFLIDVPGTEQQLAPAVRLMAWIDAAARFLDSPLLGTGIGSNAVAVRYVDPSGIFHLLTDAHNVFLNIAVQCGLLGLAAILWLVVKVAALTRPFRLRPRNALRLGLGVAWLCAFVVEGLTGSFEDARHLWVLLGLLLASSRLEHLVAAEGGDSGVDRRAALSPPA